MEGANYQTCESITLKKMMKKEEGGDVLRQVKWDITQDSNSSISMESSSDSEVDDDASSSPSSADGPLFQLSDLMNHLPISRRGLSKHYQGKSQSFTSLSHVKNLEDLAKKVSPYGISSYHKMKSCKSYAAFDCHNKFSAKATTITQKSSSSRGSF